MVVRAVEHRVSELNQPQRPILMLKMRCHDNELMLRGEDKAIAMKIVKKSASGAGLHHGGGSSAPTWRSESITTIVVRRTRPRRLGHQRTTATVVKFIVLESASSSF